MSASIDPQCHVWTPDTGHYPLAAGFRRANMEPRSFTVQELLERAQPAGVNRVVLIQMSFYGYDNRYMLDAIKMYPGKFSGVAVIDQNMIHPEAQMRELRSQGVCGVRIYPKDMPGERCLDREVFQALVHTVAGENLTMC